MADVVIRVDGQAGRITLNRPEALNALTYAMCLAIDRALRDWRDDPRVALVLIDAAGERAFCAGGDLAEMYATGSAGNYAYGQGFWADEYRMNARIAEYPKPVVSFLRGYTMGGGVGLGCHCSHAVVGESAQVAMPECSIGLVPDVGGSAILARAPGRLGDYLGTTGARMGPGDAILAGFARYFIPEARWDDLKARLAATGDAGLVAASAVAAPEAPLAARRPEIDRLFAAATMREVEATLAASASPVADAARKSLARTAPLSISVTVEMLRRLRPAATLRAALQQEYRFTFRALRQSDFLEGIRAVIIDKDRKPHWRHASVADVSEAEVAAMLAPLGADELSFEEKTP